MNIPRSLVTKKRTILIIAAIVVVVGLGWLITDYSRLRSELNQAKSPEALAKAESNDLAKEVGQYVELPADETPTVATVSDITTLADQPFFGRAQNGDKVLVFEKSKKAILYRPSTKKIIEFAPFDPGQ